MPLLPACLSRPKGDLATLHCGTTEGVTVMGSGQPADCRDDELDLVDDYDPELDLLDDLDDWDED